jgi:putative SOS response-associated peptidase YedK
MFSRMQLLADSQAVALRFGAKGIQDDYSFFPKAEISGFEHALHPILLQNNGQLVCSHFYWGLVPPDWKKKPEDIWNHTISAKLEYISRRYAWQKVSQNRCLIPATAYFEYHWNDPKGNSKTKFIIKNDAVELFALAGLFSSWRNQEGNLLNTFAACTTMANETMRFVHNKDAGKNYHRMPVMLNRSDEKSWLDATIPYMDFAFPNYQPKLVATPVETSASEQIRLF